MIDLPVPERLRLAGGGRTIPLDIVPPGMAVDEEAPVTCAPGLLRVWPRVFA